MRLSAARPEPTENDKGLRERAGPAADTMNETANQTVNDGNYYLNTVRSSAPEKA